MLGWFGYAGSTVAVQLWHHRAPTQVRLCWNCQRNNFLVSIFRQDSLFSEGIESRKGDVWSVAFELILGQFVASLRAYCTWMKPSRRIGGRIGSSVHSPEKATNVRELCTGPLETPWDFEIKWPLKRQYCAKSKADQHILCSKAPVAYCKCSAKIQQEIQLNRFNLRCLQFELLQLQLILSWMLTSNARSTSSNSVCLHSWLHGSHVAGERHAMAAGLRQASEVEDSGDAVPGCEGLDPCCYWVYVFTCLFIHLFIIYNMYLLINLLTFNV